MKAKKLFVCLFCDKNFRSKAVAKKHSCSQKQEAEKRIGADLTTYDAVQRAIEIENEVNQKSPTGREEYK